MSRSVMSGYRPSSRSPNGEVTMMRASFRSLCAVPIAARPCTDSKSHPSPRSIEGQQELRDRNCEV